MDVPVIAATTAAFACRTAKLVDSLASVHLVGLAPIVQL